MKQTQNSSTKHKTPGCNLHDHESETILCGNSWDCKREIASLTKVMTCYTVLKIMEKYNLNKHSTIIKVGKYPTEQIGTSANL
jgi:D-alanyl-D-alanine carboxypeptidase